MSGEQMPDFRSVLQHSPNGIVMVDRRVPYPVCESPRFAACFLPVRAISPGQKAWKLLRSDCFERAFETDDALSVRGTIPDQDVHYRATLFKLEDGNRCCGIFIDTSEEERARAELSQVRRETLARAQEVIRRQMQTAQEIAGLLGETTGGNQSTVGQTHGSSAGGRDAVKIYYEFGLHQMNKKKEELCGDSVEYSLRPDSATLVFSDGLGSGVKASILSTLTTRIATRMLDQGLPLAEVVQTVSETLPICRERKIAYSTFCMAQFSSEGHATLAAYDSPPPLLVRRGKLETLLYEERDIARKCIHEYFLSDAARRLAGLGFGWSDQCGHRRCVSAGLGLGRSR